MREESQLESIDARVQRFASAHHGVITNAELSELGLSRSAISRRRAAGLLVRLRPGVFRVQGSHPSWIQDLYAVCRWLGPNVVASHRAAARLHGIGDVRANILEVTVSVGRRGARNVIIHASAEMPPRDRRLRELIPVTDPTRTCIDCCAVLSEKAAEHVIDDACHQRLTTSERLMARVDEMSAKGRDGLALARKLIEKRIRYEEMPESRLTRMVLRLIQESPLPNPVSLHPVRLPNGVTIHPDLAYPSS
jgi:predicted transcriptional regulator of viral defense system